MTEAFDRELIFDEGAFFASCHASTVLPLEDGTVLVAYFAGTQEKDPDVGIWLSRRVDGVWQRPRRIAKTEQTAHWNPVLFRCGEGVRIVYKVGEEIPDWKSRTMVSRDRGITWSAEVRYGGRHDACGPVRAKPLLASNGELLAPNSGETADAWWPWVDVSDDGGASFRLLATVPINTQDPAGPDYIRGKGAIQPTMWESQPGHIHMLLRTTSGFVFRSDSDDFGRTWRRAYNTGLPNNNSGIDVAKHASGLYLVCNPVSGNWAARTPLVVLRSTDNGQTFTRFRTLDGAERDPISGRPAELSYPAAVVLGDRLHVTYTYMRRQIAFCTTEL